MQKLFGWLSARRWFISLPLILIAGLVAYVAVFSLLDWANSTKFCGTTCHIMTPEYTAYQGSPHARVRCANCHVGPGLGAEVKAKWEGVRELVMNLTKTYEKPIPSPVESLRPARETCEQCHWPEIFYNDQSTVITSFADDQANTRTNTYMLLRIGGGTSRTGQGYGIHWHIENKVEYVATDAQRQDIPWVRAQIDGQTVTFVDAENPISEQDLGQYEVRVMDCIDCHNRATHVFASAKDSVDEAMANGQLPADLPFLHKYAVEVMDATYPDQATALTAIANVAGRYQQEQPDVYTARQQDIQQAVQTLQTIYSDSHFPDWQVYPTTYPDNIGHDESAGCFRCHDGKHLSQGGQSIRLHCNICHTIPQTVAADQPAPALAPDSPQQPASHLASDWMAAHRQAVNETCSSCHEMATFCANPNCHGRSWPEVNLEAVTPPFPIEKPGETPVPALPTGGDQVARGAALFEQNCVACHPQVRSVAEEGEFDEGEFARTVQNGTEGMPAFPLDAAQLGDLAAFVTWRLANPDAPLPVTTPAATPAPAATPSGTAVSFAKDILPVLQAKCGSSCHSAAAATAGFKAVDYAGISAVITPGNPDGSRLVQVQRENHPVKLSADELNAVINWIQAGAPDN